jgi:hypothetical protein
MGVQLRIDGGAIYLLNGTRCVMLQGRKQHFSVSDNGAIAVAVLRLNPSLPIPAMPMLNIFSESVYSRIMGVNDDIVAKHQCTNTE